jgi:hypothetical protein
MGIDDLEVANTRLRGEGDFIAAPTRYLGHFVVGQLASETGVRVELRPSPVTGITARVTLPESLLVRPMVVEAPPSTVLADSSSRLPSGRPALPQPTGPDTGTWSVHPDEPVPTGPVLTAIDTPPAGSPLVGAGSGAGEPGRGNGNGGGRSANYRDELFGTGPFGTGPIPTVPAAAPGPAAPGSGVRAASVGLRAASSDDGEADRTRNGLRKRVRKDARPEGDVATPPRGFARPAPTSVLDDSPDMVRNRLMAFRSGMERGLQGDDNASASGAPRRSGVDPSMEEPE